MKTFSGERQPELRTGIRSDADYIWRVGKGRGREGAQQQVAHFSRDQLPLAVALVVDLSGSIQPFLRPLRYATLTALKTLKPEDQVALITDGRFSGGTRGACIGHVSPEAAGPTAVILFPVTTMTWSRSTGGTSMVGNDTAHSPAAPCSVGTPSPTSTRRTGLDPSSTSTSTWSPCRTFSTLASTGHSFCDVIRHGVLRGAGTLLRSGQRDSVLGLHLRGRRLALRPAAA